MLFEKDSVIQGTINDMNMFPGRMLDMHCIKGTDIGIL